MRTTKCRKLKVWQVAIKKIDNWCRMTTQRAKKRVNLINQQSQKRLQLSTTVSRLCTVQTASQSAKLRPHMYFLRHCMALQILSIYAYKYDLGHLMSLAMMQSHRMITHNLLSFVLVSVYAFCSVGVI